MSPDRHSDDEVRAQLAGRVLLAMKRSSESIDFVLSARQRHLAVGDGGDDGDGDGEGDEGCNSGACGIDDGGSWRPPDHDLHSAAHAHSGPSDGDAEEASEDAALHSPWQGAGDGESFLDASIQLALEVEHDVDRPREEGVFGADTVRQVLEEALESATSSPRPARLSSAGSFTRAESASSADSQPENSTRSPKPYFSTSPRISAPSGPSPITSKRHGKSSTNASARTASSGFF